MNRASIGTVYLVGAGPGDPELLTVRAHSLLRSADAVFHDDLVPLPILDLCRRNARVVSVGKRCGVKAVTQEQINELLIEAARCGQSVIRLKNGDPLLYGRASEELAALEGAAIPCEVVPGVSAVFAAASDMCVSLTDRFSASRLIVLTWHRARNSGHAPLWKGDLPADATVAVYMPGSNYRSLARALLDSGLSADTPCMVVSRAGTPQRRWVRATVAELEAQEALPAPSILLAGRALARRDPAMPDLASVELSESLLLSARDQRA
jgi:uroporphyrin-III C-methyltransferase